MFVLWVLIEIWVFERSLSHLPLRQLWRTGEIFLPPYLRFWVKKVGGESFVQSLACFVCWESVRTYSWENVCTLVPNFLSLCFHDWGWALEPGSPLELSLIFMTWDPANMEVLPQTLESVHRCWGQDPTYRNCWLSAQLSPWTHQQRGQCLGWEKQTQWETEVLKVWGRREQIHMWNGGRSRCGDVNWRGG